MTQKKFEVLEYTEGFCGVAELTIDKKRRVFFPKRDLTWNEGQYEKSCPLTPFIITQETRGSIAYLFPRRILREFIYSQPGIERLSDIHFDRMGRINLGNDNLRRLLPGQKLTTIGMGPYLILATEAFPINFDPTLPNNILYTVLHPEISEKLIPKMPVASEVRSMIEEIRRLIDDGKKVKIDFSLGGIRVTGEVEVYKTPDQ